ncbi:hypothetical protein FE391_01560 [Nonomuraea sp. KC401]|uniref:Rv1733c family protein n=1 Tax=unclassified Nonomuraea TaxID=2593643 RepID=UPI0010FF0FF1|nr:MULTISPECIES: hypothetical protein [unclassified Nonomuraea]NBE92150.1 hypothetical protein [Nonomuraea sp. K271]TLF85647.1 hypothetical protein FE391_01560 [Nonomuraea sp. KC401]
MRDSVMRQVRRYRFDRNPLRRRSDRLESLALLVAVLLVLLSAWPAVAAGRQAYQSAASAGAGGRLQVDATLLADVPVSPTSFGSLSRGGPVEARWTLPSGQERTGQVRAPALAKAGTTVRIWVDETGRPALPPPSALEVRITGVVTVLLVMLGAVAAVLIALAAFRWLVDRGRYRAWEDAWSLIDERRRRRRS